MTVIDSRPFLAIGIPFLAALLVSVSHKHPNIREMWSTVASLLLLGTILSMAGGVLDGTSYEYTLLPLTDTIGLSMRVDPAGLIFASLASLLWVPINFYSIGYMRNNHEDMQTGYFAAFALCIGATMGLAMAANLLTFFVFYEILTLSSYPLVLHERDEEALLASRKYLAYTLVSGQLMNAYAVSGATAADWATHTWNFDFAQVRMIGYQAQVIPAILAAITFNYLERFFKKVTPSVIQMIVVPFCSLLLAVMAAHFVLGPIGWTIGSCIGSIVLAGITSPFAWLFGLIFGAVYAPLVITGLHHMSNAVDMQLIASSNNYGTPLWPMIALSNIAQGSSVLAMSILQKHDENAQQVNIPSIISCYLGVTEPAMFGVNLKYGFPFVCAMIGSSIAGGVCTAFGVNALSIGVGGLPGILSIRPEFIGIFAVCMIIAVVVPFVLTFTIGKRQGIDKGIDANVVTLDGEKNGALSAQ